MSGQQQFDLLSPAADQLQLLQLPTPSSNDIIDQPIVDEVDEVRAHELTIRSVEPLYRPFLKSILVNFVLQYPAEINWTCEGEVIINEEVLPGTSMQNIFTYLMMNSNYYDEVDDVSLEPVGTEIVYNKLLEIAVPYRWIINDYVKHRYRFRPAAGSHDHDHEQDMRFRRRQQRFPSTPIDSVLPRLRSDVAGVTDHHHQTA